MWRLARARLVTRRMSRAVNCEICKKLIMINPIPTNRFLSCKKILLLIELPILG